MKLILENWRKFINEEEEEKTDILTEAQAAQVFVGGHDKGLEDFTAMLKQVASDPTFRKLAFAGRHDGDPADEEVIVTKGTPVAAKDLQPTQKDIDLDKSLGDQMTNKWDPPATATALSTGIIKMPSPCGAIPVLTYNNKFILDGHHRWSQVMMTNPDGKMATTNIAPSPAVPNEEVALKATQLAIAALAGNIVTKPTKTNLLSVDPKALGQYVIKNITDDVVQLLVQAGKISKPDKKEAAEYYMANLVAVQGAPAGEFERVKGMPQADDSGVPQAQVDAALKTGNINFNDPRLADLPKKK